MQGIVAWATLFSLLMFGAPANALTITSPGSSALGGTNVVPSTQTMTGTVNLSINAVGTVTGWSVTLTSAHLGLGGSDVKKRKTASGGGSTSAVGDVTVTGTYNGLNPQGGYSGTGSVPAGEFIIVVATVAGSPAKPATVNITDPDGTTTNGAAVSGNAHTFNGLTVTYGGTDVFAVGDEFRLRVDAFPYTQYTDTPSNLVGTGVIPSSTNGMTLGSATTMSGSGATSNPFTTLSATALNGLGTYTYTDNVSWTAHANALQGSYTATLTYTIA